MKKLFHGTLMKACFARRLLILNADRVKRKLLACWLMKHYQKE